MQLVKKHKLPIVIHYRGAFEEVFEVLGSERGEDLSDISHCFISIEKQAHRAVDYELHLGIGGVVTSKNGGLDQFLKNIDLQHLVLETDSPCLVLVPYRGKRNESAYIAQVMQKLSDMHTLLESEVKHTTNANTTEIFRF